MPSFRKPAPEKLQQILDWQSELAFTYPGVGTTKMEAAPPAGYAVDHNRAVIGQSSTGFERARTALQSWRQFRLGWLEAFPDNTPIRAGETVVVLAKVLGIWWTNAARIVYTIDETKGALAKFGFAYGTLPGHVESGEERFLVEWDRTTDQVWFNILAFSRPRHLLTRLGHRHARAVQKRFAQQSTAAMQSAAST
jgi:uncharacterized protein (UPF0548 family)